MHDATKSIRLTLNKLFFGLIILSISLPGFTSVWAQSVDSSAQTSPSENVQVARISLVQYYLSMMRGDDPDWFDASVNMPVQTGDRLYVGDSGLAELQIGSNLFVRLSASTGLDVLDLSKDRSQFRMYSGSLVINLRTQPAQSIEVDTPSAAITFADAGEYRINVLSDKKAEVIVRQGNAEVYNGNQVLVRAGQRMVLDTDEETAYNITGLPEQDTWDQWNQQRDNQLAQEAASLNDIADNQSVEGIEDLTDNGQWINSPDYGEVWTPNDVSDDWAPYQDGGWVWRDPCGWTWVSSESWGWAPYHYGSWAYVGSRWCWVPGRDRNYSPAQVGFIGYGNGNVGWVPLAPGDKPIRRGSAMDRNGVRFVNQNNRNAVSVATKDGFSGGNLTHHNTIPARRGDVVGKAISGPNITPTRNSLSPTAAGKTIFPRQTPAYFNRPVVTRNDNVPVVRSFNDKAAEIKANGGAPVSSVKLTPSGTEQTQRVTQPGAINRPAGSVNAMQPQRRLVPDVTTATGQQTNTQPQVNNNRQQNAAEQSPRNTRQTQQTVQQQSGEQATSRTRQPVTGNTNQPQRNAGSSERNTQEPQRNVQQEQEQERQRALQQQETDRQRQQQAEQDRQRQEQDRQQRQQQEQAQQRQQQEQQRQEQARQQQQEQERQQQQEQQRQQQEQERQHQQEQQRQQQEQERQRQQEQQRQQQEQQRQQQEQQQRQQQEQQRQQLRATTSTARTTAAAAGTTAPTTRATTSATATTKEAWR